MLTSFNMTTRIDGGAHDGLRGPAHRSESESESDTIPYLQHATGRASGACTSIRVIIFNVMTRIDRGAQDGLRWPAHRRRARRGGGQPRRRHGESAPVSCKSLIPPRVRIFSWSRARRGGGQPRRRHGGSPRPSRPIGPSLHVLDLFTRPYLFIDEAGANRVVGTVILRPLQHKQTASTSIASWVRTLTVAAGANRVVGAVDRRARPARSGFRCKFCPCPFVVLSATSWARRPGKIQPQHLNRRDSSAQTKVTAP